MPAVGGAFCDFVVVFMFCVDLCFLLQLRFPRYRQRWIPHGKAAHMDSRVCIGLLVCSVLQRVGVQEFVTRGQAEQRHQQKWAEKGY